MAVGQVFYTPWCDEHGAVIDDGTVSRLDEQLFRWTAADPSLRWFRQNAAGLRVSVEDVSEEIAALALQGPTSARVLRAASDVDLEALKYFRVASGDDWRRAGRYLPHRLHRRSRLRGVDAGGSMPCASGMSLMELRAAVRHQARRDARARRGARRSRAAPHRRRLLQQQEGAHRDAEVHALRDGPRPAGLAHEGSLHRPAGAARRARAWPRAAGRRPRARLDGGRVDLRAARAAADRRRDRVARRGAGLPRRPAGRPRHHDHVVAGAEEDDRAGDRGPAALCRRHGARDRSDGRSRAPPRQGDGRAAAVLQSALGRWQRHTFRSRLDQGARSRHRVDIRSPTHGSRVPGDRRRMRAHAHADRYLVAAARRAGYVGLPERVADRCLLAHGVRDVLDES